jgi:hypothetical protein
LFPSSPPQLAACARGDAARARGHRRGARPRSARAEAARAVGAVGAHSPRIVLCLALRAIIGGEAAHAFLPFGGKNALPWHNPRI